MKNNITEIVFILDRSGSMAGLEKDTIGGFNAFIDRQKKEEGKALISCVLFDYEQEVIYDRVSLDKIKPMTSDEYYVRGCTAMNDAIGSAIHHIKNIHKYARIEDVPEKTMFIITTDGYENASKHYSKKFVHDLIHEQKQKGWEFLFLGANIDAEETAEELGIERSRAVTYTADEVGTACNFDAINAVASKFRRSKSKKEMQCFMEEESWKDDIKKHNTKRR